MLKQRIIGVLLVREGIVVQSIGFKKWLPVGKPAIAVEHLNRWGIDEIALLNISPQNVNDDSLHRMIADVAPYCFVPLAIGGGIRTIAQVHDAIRTGADRVIMTTAVADNPSLITQAANRFGSQAIIAAIDVRKNAQGDYDAYVDYGRRKVDLPPAALAKRAEEHGAGEILVQAIHRDGSRQGYDLELIELMCGTVGVPVIALGGVGAPAHMADAMPIAGVGGLAAGNYLHYTEHTAAVAKAALMTKGGDLRHDSYADYEGFAFDASGRLKKKTDATLMDMMFVHYTDEVI
jgi:cyclase